GQSRRQRRRPRRQACRGGSGRRNAEAVTPGPDCTPGRRGQSHLRVIAGLGVRVPGCQRFGTTGSVTAIPKASPVPPRTTQAEGRIIPILPIQKSATFPLFALDLPGMQAEDARIEHLSALAKCSHLFDSHRGAEMKRIGCILATITVLLVTQNTAQARSQASKQVSRSK